jgi:hypothetical protein
MVLKNIKIKHMGNILSKMCYILSYPVRLRERKKVEKIYREVFTDDMFDINEEGINMNVRI